MVDIAAGSVAFDMAAVCSHVALPAAEQHSLLVQNEFLQARSSWSKPELDPWDQGITTCPGTDLSDVPTSFRVGGPGPILPRGVVSGGSRYVAKTQLKVVLWTQSLCVHRDPFSCDIGPGRVLCPASFPDGSVWFLSHPVWCLELSAYDVL